MAGWAELGAHAPSAQVDPRSSHNPISASQGGYLPRIDIARQPDPESGSGRVRLHARSIEPQCYHGQVRIYLDYNATAPPLPEVIATVGRVMATTIGNASSVHAFGQQAKAELDAARTSVAHLIGAEPSEIVFTSGGTESDNLAIRGAAEALEPAGRRHIITTAIEHEAVLNTVRALERRGWETTVLPVDQTGVLSPDALRQALRPDTALVSVMHANNEIGAVQPIDVLAPLARAAGALFHTDAVQSAGKIPVNVRQLGVDALSLSAHKFGGPKGTGALWIRRGVRLVPHMTGGRQERGRRAGTENVPALAGMGVAARVAAETVAAGVVIARLRDRLEAGILAHVPGTVVNGDTARRVPNTSNISFDGIEAESLLIALDLEGVAISTGSACSSGSLEPSHVLRAMGLPNARARNSLRFSLGPTTTSDEVDFVVGVLPRLVSRLRQLGRPAAAVR
ncbi:MAG: cysteine desulfurase [Acidobacteria bacterium]|nr:cysteine desulfurase [Acidobacteriota bacterium]